MLALLRADARSIPLADGSVQCVVTSPPYWGLRKYSGEQELVWGGREDCEHEWGGELPSHHPGQVEQTKWKNAQAAGHGQTAASGCYCQVCGAWRGAYGLEPTVEMYVQHTVEILREIRRVLRADGVLFLNIGDSYGAGTTGTRSPSKNTAVRGWTSEANLIARNGQRAKDLCLIPFRVALAAQADGWWVRSDIIWSKPNPMPESVTDRPTRSHEYILMLTKSANYYWDAEAASERSITDPNSKAPMMFGSPNGKHNTPELAHAADLGHKWEPTPTRNMRSVWEFSTIPYPEAHFATFPEELPKRCILAATKLGDLVLDPFAGSGTVGKVAIEMGRRAILCDLAYQDLASKRTAAIQRPLIAPDSAGWRE